MLAIEFLIVTVVFLYIIEKMNSIACFYHVYHAILTYIDTVEWLNLAD